jgi:hypothetical protein
MSPSPSSTLTAAQFDTGQLDQKTAWAGLFNLRVGEDWSPGPNGDFLISEGSPKADLQSRTEIAADSHRIRSALL